MDTETGHPNAGKSVEAPGIYPFRIGDLEAFIISDGTLFVQPLTKLSANGPEEAVRELLDANLHPLDHAILNLNILVIRTARDVVVFDTGIGPRRGGRLPRNLRSIGIEPSDVTAVVVSHAHGDHIAGLLTLENEIAFPNARHLIGRTEYDFWIQEKPDLSRTLGSSEVRTAQIECAREYLTALKDRWEWMEPGDILFDCVEVMEAPGHTPGQLIFRIHSKGEELIHIVDVAHSHILMIQATDWGTIFDAWPDVGVETRRRILKMLATHRTRMLAYHFPFPGLGRIGANGDAFRWHPEQWHWIG